MRTKFILRLKEQTKDAKECQIFQIERALQPVQETQQVLAFSNPPALAC